MFKDCGLYIYCILRANINQNSFTKSLLCISFCEIINIVGYQAEDLPNVGYNFIIPTFIDVAAGTATYDLQGIKLVGAPGEGNEMIKVYNGDAVFTKQNYFWLTEDGYGSDFDGWFDAKDKPITGVTLPLGTGLYLYCKAKNVKVQYAGQVYQGGVELPLPVQGYNMVGNATPSPISIQDLKLVGAPGEGNEMIKVYNSDAVFTKQNYFWLTEDGYGSDFDGWFDSKEKEIVRTLAPGEGVYVYCKAKNVKYSLPAAVK